MERLTLLFAVFATLICPKTFAQTFDLDPDFGLIGSTIVNQVDEGWINSIVLQPDGKIVGVGSTSKHGNFDNSSLFRLNQNGQFDSTFGLGGIVVSEISLRPDGVRSAVLQPDGKILVAGYMYAFINSQHSDFALSRYLPNGIIDSSFSQDGITLTDFMGLQDDAYSVKMQPDGKIIVAGFAVNGNVSDAGDIALVRFMPDGTQDDSFGISGKVISGHPGKDRASCMLIRPDGKILVGGSAISSVTSMSTFMLAQYTETGDLDTTFGNNGMSISHFGSELNLMQDMVLQPDGKVIAIGSTYSNGKNNIVALRYNIDGTLDLSFANSGIFIAPNFGRMEGYSVALQPDGKIIVGGLVGNPSLEDFALLRLLPNGALDYSFGSFSGLVKTDFGAHNHKIYTIALQDDGMIVVGGLSTYDIQYASPIFSRYKEGFVNLVPDPMNSFSIFLTPNPVIQNARLEYELKEDAIVSIQLFDVKGNVLKAVCMGKKQTAGKYFTTIEYPTELQPGCYLLSILIGDEKIILKTIKQ